jgi:hypothetical protein
MTSLISLTIGWAVLLAIVVMLAFARRWAARNEDDSLHLHDFDAATNQQQSSLARKLSRLDATGKTLTALMVLYGIALLARVVYLAWMDSLQIK